MSASLRKWWILFSMCLITVILGIDATAFNLALPVISHEFYTSLSCIQWVMNAFFLLAAMVQIAGGYFGDCYGHKKIFLLSVAFFILSSLGAGLSINEGMLIAFRALQGASIGIAYPQTIVLVTEAFPVKEQSYARSFIVTTMGLALAAGAPLGGLLVHTIGWRWIFYLNLPLGLLSYFIAQTYCPKKEAKGGKIHLKSLLFLIISLFGIAFSWNQVQDWGFSSPFFLSFFIGGLFFLYLLYLLEKGKKDKLIEFQFFKNLNFAIHSILRFIVQIIFLALLFFLPLYLQNIAEVSALQSGLTLFSLTLVMSIISPIAGKWVDQKGDKIPSFVSMLFLLVGSFLLLGIQAAPNFYLLCFSLFFFGIGIAISFVSTTTGALEAAPPKKLGSASGLFFTVAWISCTAGVAFSGTILSSISKALLPEKLPLLPPLSPSSQLDLLQRISKGLSPLSTLSMSPSMQKVASSIFIEAIHANGWMFLLLCFLGAFLACFLRKPLKKRKTVH